MLAECLWLSCGAQGVHNGPKISTFRAVRNKKWRNRGGLVRSLHGCSKPLHGKDIKVLSVVPQTIASPREASLVVVWEVLVEESCKNRHFLRCCCVPLTFTRDWEITTNSTTLPSWLVWIHVSSISEDGSCCKMTMTSLANHSWYYH